MLLRPDPVMNQILLYLLAVTAARHRIQVHAFCAMSTHMHLVVTDEHCELPEFLHAFHRMVACCTMVHRKWPTSIWDTSPTSVVRLETSVAIEEKIAYVLANPVAAGLVRRAHEWPGATVHANQLGKGTFTARRPEVYLNPQNTLWPAEATLRISLPPGIEPGKAARFRKRVTTELRRLEAQAHATSKEQGRRVLGPEGARSVSPTTRATSPEPIVGRNPTFAVGRKQGDAWHRAAAAVRAFRAAYQAALARWCARERTVVFPAGTWLMRVLHGAASDTAAPAAA